MFGYYLKLAAHSARQSPGLTLLMVLTIALGIGAAMTTITIQHLMSANPIPQKSEQLFLVQLDSWDPAKPFFDNGNPPDILTYRDATALWQSQQARRQAMMSLTSAVIEPPERSMAPFIASGRATSADFFAMFDVPFLYGGGWDHNADIKQDRTVVLSKKLNERLFGGQDSSGQSVRLAGQDFRIIGVLDHWQPRPRFYDIGNGAFADSEDFYLPVSLVVHQQLKRLGNSSCWQPVPAGFRAFLDSECVWLQLWVELPDAAAVAQYQGLLQAYTAEQRKLGRFARPDNNRLSNVMQLLEQQQVVSEDVRLMVLLALMFLAVCLLNTVGLLLARFSAKAGEIGVRQALGASRQHLFWQHLTEAGCIGLAGGVLGLGLSALGLWAVQMLYGHWMRDLAVLDGQMVALAIALALLSSLLAGLYPTWRACQIQPALQLKSQ